MKRILIFNSGGFVYGAEKGLINLVKAIKGKFIITVVLPKRGLLARKLKSISAIICTNSLLLSFPGVVAKMTNFVIYFRENK